MLYPQNGGSCHDHRLSDVASPYVQVPEVQVFVPASVWTAADTSTTCHGLTCSDLALRLVVYRDAVLFPTADRDVITDVITIAVGQ